MDVSDNDDDTEFKRLDRKNFEETVGADDDGDADAGSETERATVELRAEVDVSEATNEQIRMYQQMATIFQQQFTVFVHKNLGYGSSFLSAGKAEMALDGGDGPFNSDLESNLYGVWKRNQDKNQRFYEQAFCGGDDPVGEDIAETSGDAANYWMMLKWLALHGDESRVAQQGELVADGGYVNEYADDARQKGYFEESDEEQETDEKADDDALGGVVD